MNNFKIARNILETANNACDCTNDDYTFTELKELMQEIIDKLDEDDDFYIKSLACGEVRIIKSESIITTMSEDIFEGCDYTLGCFNADFIASNTDLNFELVEACQKAEAFEAIGEAMNSTMTEEEKESFCEAYAQADGYGHHFSSYDGKEHSTDTHYIFRTN